MTLLRRLGAPLAAVLPACAAGAGLVACAGSPPDDGRDERNVRSSFARGERIELPNSPEFAVIADLEYARTTGGGRLLELVRHADDRVRERAALALGRLPWPEFGEEVTATLCDLLEDPVDDVRVAAAFALGLRADPGSAGVLAAYRNDSDPELRAGAVEAASKVADPRLHRELLLALRDGDPRVRIEAALGTARWDPEAPDADEVDRALLDALRPYALRPSGPARAIEPEFVWRVLYALSRRRADLGRGAFLEYATAQDPLVRLFAVRGLVRIPADPEIGAALARALADPASDWRVAYEAVVGLGQWADPSALDPLLDAVEHSSSHVRAAALAAVGRVQAEREAVLPRLRRGQLDVSAVVRAEALKALVRLVGEGDALRALREEAGGEDAVVRAGVAEACAALAVPRTRAILEDLVDDPEPRVATTAVAGLAAFPDRETRAILHRILRRDDPGLRLAAVLALREMPAPEDVGPLAEASTSSTGDVAAEIAFEVLENLGRIGGEEARGLVEDALEDPRPHVRRVARRVLREGFGEDPPPLEGEVALGPPGRAPQPGSDFPRYHYDPLVEIVTSRGSLVFELFPAEAPVHVHNFVQLARAGHYDGLTFHRVVPDFVVQGGDYRGDGNGSAPWNDAFLPHEIGPRKFTRGSLGMPRNEDPDSGGSQFFVTHRPTPHLDGRYTIFGELRAGGEVLDRIEAGDRIQTVRPLR